MKFLPDAQVKIFGSVVKKQFHPGSDFDVLIITKAKIKGEILKLFPYAPFEIHIVNPKEFKNWYRRFIKTDYLKV